MAKGMKCPICGGDFMIVSECGHTILDVVEELNNHQDSVMYNTKQVSKIGKFLTKYGDMVKRHVDNRRGFPE